MYGVISSNLEQDITTYLIERNINIGLVLNKPIGLNWSNYVTVEFTTLSTLIIDTSIFYEDNILMEFLFHTKTQYPQVRIILISFSKRHLTDGAILGIYDVIHYKKVINLAQELDEIILKPKTLNDIKEFLNVQIIQNQKNSNTLSNIIISFGLNHAVFATSFWLGYCSLNADKKRICYVEINKKINQLTNLFKVDNFASVDNMTIDIFSYNKFNILFAPKCEVNEELILKIILNLSQNYDEVIFDVSYDSINIYDTLINSGSKIYTFDRLDIHTTNYDYKKTIQKSSKFEFEFYNLEQNSDINTLDDYIGANKSACINYFNQNVENNILKKIIKKIKRS